MKPSYRFFRFVKFVVVGFCRTFWKVTYEGLENVPKSGAYIIAPTHRAYTDTPLVAPLTHRHIRYMGASGLFKYKLSAAFFERMGTFPVHRGSVDRETLRTCINLLKEGHPVVIFPEGTRKRGPKIENLFEGVGYIASRANAPIVPVAIGGAERGWPRGKLLPRPGRMHVLVGKPIEIDRQGDRIARSEVRELNAKLQESLQELFDKAQAEVGA